VQKSDVLDFQGFSGWLDFTRLVDAKEAGRKPWAQLAPPQAPGVYFFATSLSPRTHGESEIFYIGKANNLRARLGKYLYRVKRSAEPGLYDGFVGALRSPEQGVASLVEQGSSVEIGWLVTETKEAASQMEAKLLAAYSSEHGQLPPNNRIGGVRL